MDGAGSVIMFVAVLAGLTIWTSIYLLFAAHYFLVTLIDTGTGQDEVSYPTEPLLDRWWKPIFCLWLFVFWVIVGSMLLAPLLIEEKPILAIVLAMLVWVMFPISVLSALTTRLWIHVVHLPIVWRLLRHYGSLAYVYLITLFIAGCTLALLLGVFGHSLLWALPAAFVVPTALLLYARHWGRLVWLAHAEAPKKKKRRRARPNDDKTQQAIIGIAQTPAVATVPSDAICEGLPASPHAFEEEDEWDMNKKPYVVADTESIAHAVSEQSPANKPISLGQYYDEQMDREEKRKEKQEGRSPSKKTPTFKSALVLGVWEFMVYPRTLQVWINLVVLTMVELFFLAMAVRFWPDL